MKEAEHPRRLLIILVQFSKQHDIYFEYLSFWEREKEVTNWCSNFEVIKLSNLDSIAFI